VKVAALFAAKLELTLSVKTKSNISSLERPTNSGLLFLCTSKSIASKAF
jgi:hypothetical protein